MKNKLIALKTDVEFLMESYSVKYDEFMKELDSIISKHMLITPETRCVRRWVRSSHVKGELIFCIEIGFYDSEQGKIDFGSDLWLDYTTKLNELRLNSGTCGYYTKKDVYQVQRSKVISHIWENISEIENAFRCFSEKISPIVQEHLNTMHSIESEIKQIENQLEMKERENIDASVREGVYLNYTTNAIGIKMFDSRACVKKRTPKFVVVIDNNNVEHKLRIDNVVQAIYNNYINIEKVEK